MRQNITAWTEPELASPGHVVPFISVNREENGLISVQVRDATSRLVTVNMTWLEWSLFLLQASAADPAA